MKTKTPKTNLEIQLSVEKIILQQQNVKLKTHLFALQTALKTTFLKKSVN